MTNKIADEIEALIGDDYQEALDNMSQEENDFTVSKYRFIHEDAIDDILADELSCDEYVLGCFNASFIASVTSWPIVLIEAAQKGNQYEAIGRALISNDFVRELAEQYARTDGYGHHFATYDGNQYEIGKYLAFRVD